MRAEEGTGSGDTGGKLWERSESTLLDKRLGEQEEGNDGWMGADDDASSLLPAPRRSTLHDSAIRRTFVSLSPETDLHYSAEDDDGRMRLFQNQGHSLRGAC